jgi:hypothetical protein
VVWEPDWAKAGNERERKAMAHANSFGIIFSLKPKTVGRISVA